MCLEKGLVVQRDGLTIKEYIHTYTGQMKYKSKSMSDFIVNDERLRELVRIQERWQVLNIKQGRKEKIKVKGESWITAAIGSPVRVWKSIRR